MSELRYTGTAEALILAKERIAALEAEVERLQVDAACDVCCGKGKLDSGKPCLCGGSGLARDGVVELRRLYIEADEERDQLREEKSMLLNDYSKLRDEQ